MMHGLYSNAGDIVVGQYAEYYLVLRVVAKAVDTANWCPDDNQRSLMPGFGLLMGPVLTKWTKIINDRSCFRVAQKKDFTHRVA